jgi:hypothetical protein
MRHATPIVPGALAALLEPYSTSTRRVSDHKPSFGGKVGKVVTRQLFEIVRGNTHAFADRQTCQCQCKCFERFWRYDLHASIGRQQCRLTAILARNVAHGRRPERMPLNLSVGRPSSKLVDRSAVPLYPVW